MKRSLGIALVTIAAIAAVLFLAGLIPHSPDITRPRVESDLAAVWPNQYRRALALEGRTAPSAVRDSVACDKGGPDVPDRGPGRNWVCMVTAGGVGVPQRPIRYELIVRSEACYTATDPALIEDPFVNDVQTGKSVGNPLYQFDGCFDVYDKLS